MTTSARALPRAGVAALLTAVALGAGAIAPAAAADGTAPWTIATAANDYGSQRHLFEYSVNPGDRIDDGIVVTNTGADALRLAVYGADAYTTDSGPHDLRPAGGDAADIGAWLKPSVDHVDVAPGATADVPFTIALPADARSGDHLGGIVTSRTVGGQEQRVVLSVHVHVAGFFEPGLEVEDVRMTYDGPAVGTGDATVTYTLRNTGNAILSARQEVSVDGPFGAFAAHADDVANAPYLLPGESRHVSVPVPGVARTGWLATSVSVAPLYTDPAGSTSQLTAATASAHAWALSWLVVLVAVVLVALLGLLVGLVLRPLRRSRTGRHTAAEPETWPGELAEATSRTKTT